MHRNHFTPVDFGNALYFAMLNSDRYVWVYSELDGAVFLENVYGYWQNPKEHARPTVPEEYLREIKRAREGRNLATDRDKCVSELVKDPDPAIARYIRFEKPKKDDDPFSGGSIPEGFVKIAELPVAGWRFRTDYLDEGEGLAWFDPATPTEGWRQIRIGDFDEFGAVDEALWCYINGELVAWNDGDGDDLWNRPFALDVTGRLPSEATCTIVFRTLDRFQMDGIWKPVSIVTRK